MTIDIDRLISENYDSEIAADIACSILEVMQKHQNANLVVALSTALGYLFHNAKDLGRDLLLALIVRKAIETSDMLQAREQDQGQGQRLH